MYMHDRCMTYVVDIGRTTDYATQKNRQSHDDYGCPAENLSKMAKKHSLSISNPNRRTLLLE